MSFFRPILDNQFIITTAFLHIGILAKEGNEYGVRLHYDSNTGVQKFLNSSEIADMYGEFAYWYNICHSYYWGPYVFLGLGINNGSQLYTNYTGGNEWANIMEEVKTELATVPFNTKIFLVGAADIEPGFNNAFDSREFVRGYVENTAISFYNFGTADGCPTIDFPHLVCGSSYGVWTSNDMMYVTSGAISLRVVPEIYSTDTSNAQQ